MTDYIEPNLAGDIGVYPDPTSSGPTEPRLTADFINYMWACRRYPVYTLHPKEVEILQSNTFKGWLWRSTLKLLHYSRPAGIRLEAWGEPTVLTLGAGTTPESERTMKHYLTIARRWPTTPESDVEPAQPDNSTASTLCDSTHFTPDPPRKPSKRRPTKKRKPRKSK